MDQAVKRLTDVVAATRQRLAQVKAPGSTLHTLGLFIIDSADLLSTAKGLFDLCGQVDETSALDVTKAGLFAMDMPTSIAQLSLATRLAQRCRDDLAKAETRSIEETRAAEGPYLRSVEHVIEVAENLFRCTKVAAVQAAAASKPKPTPPAPPKVDPQALARAVAEQMMATVKGTIDAALSAHTEAERNEVQRLVSDKLGDLKDSLRTREDMRELKALQAAGELDRRFAGMGKTINTMVDRRIQQSQSQLVKDADRLAKMQARQVRKDLLDRLEEIEASEHAMGEMPRHEWDGTKIRFEQEPGVFGPWVDLEGPAGRNGLNGGGGGVPKNLVLDGGGAFDEHTTINGGTASSINQFALGGGGANTKYSTRVFNGGRAF
ncbi:hypothetical protein [Pseudorhodoferax sp. Leaf267]|uniref:hypothetical protein n=1 Tax=Pseudorhodoferax sp. Leaf267 TaxID=1736316 RepID=UPI0006F9DB16|nr:hypothetical protein [Pseudorhodoferax sp. Leaf267]KQP20557.1 hypothetical protein ASF43_27420 [Pseudorhodoferax sp. Leaf267]